MFYNFKIVKIDSDYCDYLREFDDKVPYNKNQKELRPFVGILFKIKNFEYFAPLSSPKPKHRKMKNNLDFSKIDNGQLGVINFNNMIPVNKSNYTLINLDEKTNNNLKLKYNNMLKQQLNWLNANAIQIKNKSRKLYDLYTNHKLPDNIKDRCCNFKLLEEKCNLYDNVKVVL